MSPRVTPSVVVRKNILSWSAAKTFCGFFVSLESHPKHSSFSRVFLLSTAVSGADLLSIFPAQFCLPQIGFLVLDCQTICATSSLNASSFVQQVLKNSDCCLQCFSGAHLQMTDANPCKRTDPTSGIEQMESIKESETSTQLLDGQFIHSIHFSHLVWFMWVHPIPSFGRSFRNLSFALSEICRFKDISALLKVFATVAAFARSD